MSTLDRRQFLATGTAAGVVAAKPWLQPCAIAGDQPKERRVC
jgi:hypothetical protein